MDYRNHKNRQYNALLQFIVVLVLLYPSVVFSQSEQGVLTLTGIWNGREVEYRAGQVMIRIDEGALSQDVETILLQSGATAIGSFDRLNIALVDFPTESDVFGIIEQLGQSPLIMFAEPNLVYHLSRFPNDPWYQGWPPADYPHQWALHNTGQYPPGGTSGADIDAQRAWTIEKGSPGILIDILDTGIDMELGPEGWYLDHLDLNDPDKYILGPDVSPGQGNDGVPSDMQSHGTHVTGIAAAETDNGIGIAGACPNCRVYVVQVHNLPDGADENSIKNGILAAVDVDCQVINISLGGPENQVVESAVKDAYEKGVLIVASAGNSGQGQVVYPAAYAFHSTLIGQTDGYENVVSVAATDHNDQRTSYSSFDPVEININVAAPGGYGGTFDEDDIFSAFPSTNGGGMHETYGWRWGTSMAAPHVSGVAALILSRFPGMSPLDVRDLLEQSAEDVNLSTLPGEDVELGWGRINAYYAVATPATPANFQVEGNIGQHPTLSWNPNVEPDLVGYEIYRRLTDQGPWYNLLATVDDITTEFTDYEIYVLSGGKLSPQACYKIRALDVSDQTSGYTPVKCKPYGYGKWAVDIDVMPDKYQLCRNFPNPFNPTTTIPYDLPEQSHVSLVIYDILGREVRTLLDNREMAGFKSMVWDGKDNRGNTTSAGIYIYALRAWSQESEKTYHKTRKMVLLR